MKKSAIICACVCLLVLPGIPLIRKAVAGKAVAEKTAADKAAAKKIFQQGGRKPAGMVNGEPFFQEDLDVYIAELRAAVAMHYGRKYKLGGTDAKFWDTKYEGTTPREFITKLALGDLARNMVLIQEARARGIDAPQTYHDLEEERAAWNEPTDEIVYGPKILNPAEYNSYRITGISDGLKTALLKGELAPTVAQLRASFNSLDEGNKIAPWRVSAVRFSWDEGIPSNNEIRTAIERSLRRGLSPQETVDLLSLGYPGLSHEDFEVHSRYVSKEDEYDQERAAMLKNAAKGACVLGPDGRAELYYVTGKEGGGYYSFEEAPGLGRNKWINDQFEIFLGKKTESAQIILFTEDDFK